MRLLLISDVHANLPALEAVLEDAGQRGYDEIWNLGDYIGYGPDPNGVFKLLRGVESRAVVGNYDLKVLRFSKKKDRWRRAKSPLKFLAFSWADEQLSKKNRRYLEKLPKEIRVDHHGVQILLTHGSPDSLEEPISPETPRARLEELAVTARADIVLTGHTHEQFFAQQDSTRFINPGSVGRPGDGDARAGYGILEINPNFVQVSYFRVSYDVEKTVAAIRSKGLPEEFAEMLLAGRSLDQLVI